MKKLVSLVLLCLICLGLCGCNDKPLSVNSTEVAKIALTSANGGNITLDQSEDVASIMLALQNASCVANGSSKEQLPNEMYRFTTYSAEDKALHTMVLYSNEYLQVDTTLYKGSLSDLQTILENYCKTVSLDDLSTVFTAKASDIIEIAFYNITDKTFKLVTGQADIQAILSPLQNLKSSQKNVAGDQTQAISLYVRIKDTNEYLPAIEIVRYETGTLCKVGGKSTQVSNYNWDILYTKLAYNTMPIK